MKLFCCSPFCSSFDIAIGVISLLWSCSRSCRVLLQQPLQSWS
jgi:hypothetical protein